MDDVSPRSNEAPTRLARTASGSLSAAMSAARQRKTVRGASPRSSSVSSALPFRLYAVAVALILIVGGESSFRVTPIYASSWRGGGSFAPGRHGATGTRPRAAFAFSPAGGQRPPRQRAREPTDARGKLFSVTNLNDQGLETAQDDEGTVRDRDVASSPRLPRFAAVLASMSLAPAARSAILTQMIDAGFGASEELVQFAADLADRPEALSSALMTDFGFKPYHAHQARAGLLRLVRASEEERTGGNGVVVTPLSMTVEPTGDSVDAAAKQVGLDLVESGTMSNGATTEHNQSEKAPVPRPVNVQNTQIEENDKSPSPGNGSAASPGGKRRKAVHSVEANGKDGENTKKKPQQRAFKAVVVNQRAKRRQRKGGKTFSTSQDGDTGSNGGGKDGETTYEYGLPSNYAELYPILSSELDDDFWSFMTRPTASSQESPVREATAKVYMRHARLFLGWYLREGQNTEGLDMDAVRKRWKDGSDENSDNGDKDAAAENDAAVQAAADAFDLRRIVPTTDAASAQPVVDFVLWLRRTRHISDSYEANVLRGLTKLLKFRFAGDSSADPTYGEKSYHDVPAIRELRKLHRDANKRQANSPRSSDERKKWLDWDEYLGVVKALGREVEVEIDEYEAAMEQGRIKEKAAASARKNIAVVYQKYLVLAFFSCVPDRQRTVRELELGRTFVRDPPLECDIEGIDIDHGYHDTGFVGGGDTLSEDDAPRWIVKHGPDDYKTGGTYGDRPPLIICPLLTHHVDDFLLRWRPALLDVNLGPDPSHNFLFAKAKAGTPLDGDAVYGIVARSCYRLAGKKTNPHLLRDMIVTHVRGSGSATERDLEALALYMGHSVGMQRSSYDRRTMGQKVAPAVELLSKVNSQRKEGIE